MSRRKKIRNVLLVEPNYKNKYPPMSLMKISTYYKRLGDNVTFFKGDLKKLVLNITFDMLKKQLYANNKKVFWEAYKPQLCKFITKGHEVDLEDVPEYRTNSNIKNLIRYYRSFFIHKEYFKKEFRQFDVVCVTTLFTFYWDITIETINFVKDLCKTKSGVKVGGVMASLLPKYVKKATGIKPHVGTLASPGVLDKGNETIIDTLPLDYSILEEIEYKYPASDAYYAYMTRGCINRCKFCAVPKLEPVYKSFIPVSEAVLEAEKTYGAKRNLLLLDNNVLASSHYSDIIDDIKAAGFAAGDTYVTPNYYEIAVKNLKDGINDNGYIRSCVKQFRKLLDRLKGENKQNVYDILKENYLLEFHTAKKETILSTYNSLKPYFVKFYSNKQKDRYVDFNQGIDSRLITDDNMKKMAEIPIRPVRIAFDHWELREKYENAVRIAVQNGHTHLSNYILYNFEDKPLELYWRLKLNVELCEELRADIYSFPMKYHPIEDPNYFSNRDYIGKYWNRKFIRTVQAVLNSTKGKIGKGYKFFCRAFGKDEEEFYKLLYMPEAMIIYRLYFEDKGLTNKWWSDFSSLREDEKLVIKPIIEKNDFKNIKDLDVSVRIYDVLKYYCISSKEDEKAICNIV